MLLWSQIALGYAPGDSNKRITGEDQFLVILHLEALLMLAAAAVLVTAHLLPQNPDGQKRAPGWQNPAVGL